MQNLACDECFDNHRFNTDGFWIDPFSLEESHARQFRLDSHSK
jgi:hypothetical protein